MSSLHKQFVEYWWAWHEKTRGDTPTALTGADAKAIKSIRTRLEVAVKRKRPNATEEEVLETFKFVLLRIEQLKNTYDFKFYATATLPVLNSHLDKILGLIRTHNEGTSTESLADSEKRKFRESILRG